MNTQKGLFQPIGHLVSSIASVAILAIVMLVVAEVTLRSTIGFSFGFVEEIVSYLAVAVTFFGACVSFRKQAFFKVNFIYDKLPSGVRRGFDFAHSLFALLFCMPLLYYSAFLVYSSYTRKTVAPTTLSTPLFIPQLIIPIGIFCLIGFIGEFAWIRLRNGEMEISHQPDGAKEER